MADYTVSIDGAAFFLSANADGTFMNPFLLTLFPQSNKRLVVALDGDDVIEGTPDIDQINGNVGNDLIGGWAGDDFLIGGKGSDGLFGGDGSDFIHGGLGDDNVVGDAGNDIIRGGRGDDFLSGGDGSDLIIGELGFDRMEGGGGNDNFIVRTDSVSDPLTGQVLSNAVLNVLAADRITDFLIGFDKILLPGIQGFTDLALESLNVDGDANQDTALKTAGGYVAVLLSVDMTSLNADNFIFDPQATAIFATATRGLVTPPVLA